MANGLADKEEPPLPPPTPRSPRSPQSRFEMVIHLELQYKKRFESQDQPGGGFDSAEAGAGKTNKGEAPKGKEGPSEGKGDGENGLQGPLPHKADVCWAHILLQHQVMNYYLTGPYHCRIVAVCVRL